jgi:hypothetical protein
VALLFHTTEYSPERAQDEIMKLLRTIGARRISLEYSGSVGDTHVAGMSFSLATASGEQEFLLPVRVDQVQKVLARQGVLRGGGRRPDPSVALKHARSVAWRTLLEWLKVQAAIIETEQAKADEVMLPYLLLGTANGEGSYRMTVYEQFARQAALPAGKR